MDYPGYIVANQREESIIIQRVKMAQPHIQFIESIICDM